MSQEADIEDNLERIAQMMPLTERERELAQMQFRVLTADTLDVVADAGDAAKSAFRHIFGDELAPGEPLAWAD